MTLLNLFYYVVMTFSAVTTAVGAFTWLNNHVSLIAAVLVALAGSLMIQLGIGAFYQRFAITARSRAPISAAVWLAAALPFSLLSGGFASGANAYLWETALAQERLDGSIVAQASSPAQTVVARSSEIDRRFRDYRKFSEAEAEFEELTGQSCDGLDLPGDCGTICELRKSQAEEAGDMAALARRVLERGEIILASASGKISQSQIDRIWQEARELTRSSEMDQLRDYAQSQRQGFQGGGFETPNGPRQCLDAEAARSLGEIEALLNTPIDLPDIPPTVRDVELSGVASDNFTALGTVVSAALFGGSSSLTFREAIVADAAVFYRKFWAFSMVVELMCAMLGMRYAVARIPFQPVRRDFGLASEAETKRAEQLYQLYVALVIRQAGRTYFIEPVYGGRTLGQNAFVFARRNNLVPRFGESTVDIYDFVDLAEAQRFEATTNTRMVRVYLIRRPRRFERELANLIGYADLDQPHAIFPPLPTSGPDPDPTPINDDDIHEPRVTQFPGVQVGKTV